MKIRVVISGRGYHLSQNVPEHLKLPDAATLDNALAGLASHLGDGQALPGSCLVIVSGDHLGTLACHEPRVMKENDELVIIAPVAGG